MWNQKLQGHFSVWAVSPGFELGGIGGQHQSNWALPPPPQGYKLGIMPSHILIQGQIGEHLRVDRESQLRQSNWLRWNHPVPPWTHPRWWQYCSAHSHNCGGGAGPLRCQTLVPGLFFEIFAQATLPTIGIQWSPYPWVKHCKTPNGCLKLWALQALFMSFPLYTYRWYSLTYTLCIVRD